MPKYYPFRAQQAAIMRRGRSKFNNRRVVIDGLRFDSQAEARRYAELRALEAAGAISRLRLHPRYPLVVNGVRVASYCADFEYLVHSWPAGPGKLVTEDVKGYHTPMYRLKKKFVKALYGIEILETR